MGSLLFSASCKPEAKPIFVTPKGDKIRLRIAKTEKAQMQGLSGIKPNEFSNDEGMLFLYDKPGQRAFWMPDTYFDLDLFYLNKDFVVIDIVRSLEAHPGRAEPPPIPRAPSITAHHVLEMKAGSPISNSIKVGTKFRVEGWTR